MNGDGVSSRQHNWKVVDLGPFPQKNISPPNFTIQSFSPGIASSFTIVGLEEFVLEVNTKDAITYLNDRMARLLGASARKEAVKTPLSQWDRGDLGIGIVQTLIDSARKNGRTYIMEQYVPRAAALRLKATQAAPASESLFRFIATPVKDRVQVVVQDITHQRWLESTFSRYVSPRVIEELRRIPEDRLLTPEHRIVTVLFADLRGFSSVCLDLPPAEVAGMLNGFFATVVECIDAHDGTVDKFMGDEVMAVFGAPLAYEDHALRALLAAVEIIERHVKWQKGRADKGQAAPPVGIGIATGEVVAGNIGTAKMMDYTVLGHTVNLASRLCGKAGGMEVLTVRNTYESAMFSAKKFRGPGPLPHFRFTRKAYLNLKNMNSPVEVIRVIVGEGK